MIAEQDIVAALSDRDAATVAGILDRVAARTGDSRFTRAADMLRKRSGAGRPAKDDTAAVARLQALAASGAARSLKRAARQVARTLPAEVSERAAAKRLARKNRAAQVMVKQAQIQS